MRTLLKLLAGATGFAAFAGFPFASQALKIESWGPPHTTYFCSPATMVDYAKGCEDKTLAFMPAPQVTTVQMQQQMYYQPPQRRVRQTLRPRQAPPARGVPK